MKTTTAAIFLTLAFLGISLSATPVHAGLFDLETKLTASDGEQTDQFGWAVSISGNTALVGTDPTDNDDTGQAYLYDVSTGNEIAKLTASDAEARDRFGQAVAVNGNVAIVGAPFKNDADLQSGAAYLFDASTGNEIAKLTPTDASFGQRFGASVSIDGSTAIIGAPYNAAYLFDVTTGGQLAKIIGSDTIVGDLFGYSVAISGNTAIIGAPWNDDAGSRSGSAYLYNITTGNEIAKLTADDAAAGDEFGWSVSISGNTAIVGAYRDDDAGSAYLFDTTTGNQIAKLTAADAAIYDRFGFSVAISGNMAIVGAESDDDAGSRSGSAYVFDIATGNQIIKLTASDADAQDLFGYSVAIDGDTVIVGARNDTNGIASSIGSAYLFQASDLHGDFDADEDVDGFDFLVWQRNFGGSGPAGDANHDGTVNGSDLAAWEQNFGISGATTLAGSTAVPEPSSLLLALLLGMRATLSRSARASRSTRMSTATRTSSW